MPLMAAAVKVGIKLTKEQLDQVMLMKGIAAPEVGSGAKGNILKRDKAIAVVRSLFPDDADTEITRMVDIICGKAKSPPIDAAECPQSLVEAICSMDPDNADCFQSVLKMGLNMMSNQAKRVKSAKNEPADTFPDDGGDRKPPVLGDMEGLGAGPSSSAAASSSGSHASMEPEILAHEGTAGKWGGYTPDCLKALLPGKHTLPYVYFRIFPDKIFASYHCR
jgi:hypothetical protein